MLSLTFSNNYKVLKFESQEKKLKKINRFFHCSTPLKKSGSVQ